MTVSGEDTIISGERNIELDEEGFLNCKKCPRSFYTKIGFENHLKMQHESDLVSLLEQTQPQDSETLEMQSINEKRGPKQCQESNKLHEYNSTIHKQVDIKITHRQCNECQKYFLTNSQLQLHTIGVHKKLTP